VLVVEEEVICDFVNEFFCSSAVAFEVDWWGPHETFSMGDWDCYLLSGGLSSCWWVSATFSSWVASRFASGISSARVSSSWVASRVGVASPSDS
jgi:hypothetical protein